MPDHVTPPPPPPNPSRRQHLFVVASTRSARHSERSGSTGVCQFSAAFPPGTSMGKLSAGLLLSMDEPNTALHRLELSFGVPTCTWPTWVAGECAIGGGESVVAQQSIRLVTFGSTPGRRRLAQRSPHLTGLYVADHLSRDASIGHCLRRPHCVATYPPDQRCERGGASCHNAHGDRLPGGAARWHPDWSAVRSVIRVSAQVPALAGAAYSVTMATAIAGGKLLPYRNPARMNPLHQAMSVPSATGHRGTL